MASRALVRRGGLKHERPYSEYCYNLYRGSDSEFCYLPDSPVRHRALEGGNAMKLALIPPFSGLHYITKAFNYHLMLPQLTDNKAYADKYHELCKTDFVMMDNGAAEGNLMTDQQLVLMARKFKPSELILPDIMKDALGTIAKIEEFLKPCHGPGSSWTSHTTFMIVAQGRSFIEVTRMIEAAAIDPRITTIGLPRHLLETLGQNDARIRIAKWINKHYGKKFSIHFLGAAPSWPYELFYARELGFVRGLDTSMPFNYALQGHMLVDEDRKHIKRTENYFEATFDERQDLLARRNVTIMHQWATGSVHR